VDADWQQTAELGITTVPTHLCRGKRLTGFSSYDAFVAPDWGGLTGNVADRGTGRLPANKGGIP